MDKEASLPFGLLLPAYPHRAIRAIFRPVGFRCKCSSAHGAPLHSVPALDDLGIQRPVQRENSGTKPPAQQRIGNALDAHTFLAVVQQEAVPVTVVAALMRQLPGLAVLRVIHSRYAYSSCACAFPGVTRKMLSTFCLMMPYSFSSRLTQYCLYSRAFCCPAPGTRLSGRPDRAAL